MAECDNLVSQWLCIGALWPFNAVFFFLAHPVLVETVASFPFFHPSCTHPSYALSLGPRLSAPSVDPPPPWHVVPPNLSASQCVPWLPEPHSIEPSLIDGHEIMHK